jgi:hypothetical protein
MTDIKNIIKQNIFALFTSRNIKHIEQLPAIWYEDLKHFTADQLIYAFNKERREGSQFPSLPNIIKYASGTTDSKIQTIESWANVRKYFKEKTKGILSDVEKKAFFLVCPDGLNDWNDADNFTRGKIEREYKEVYSALISGTFVQQIGTERGQHNKQIDMDFTK